MPFVNGSSTSKPANANVRVHRAERRSSAILTTGDSVPPPSPEGRHRPRSPLTAESSSRRLNRTAVSPGRIDAVAELRAEMRRLVLRRPRVAPRGTRRQVHLSPRLRLGSTSFCRGKGSLQAGEHRGFLCLRTAEGADLAIAGSEAAVIIEADLPAWFPLGRDGLGLDAGPDNIRAETAAPRRSC